MIHQNGITYPPNLLQKLTDGAIHQQEAVFQLYRRNKSRPMPVHVVQKILGLKRIRSAGRAVTNLSDPDPKNNHHLDDSGRPPLIKTDQRVPNEDGSATVCCWKWNPNYGEPGQSSLFPEKHQSTYSGAGS